MTQGQQLCALFSAGGQQEKSSTGAQTICALLNNTTSGFTDHQGSNFQGAGTRCNEVLANGREATPINPYPGVTPESDTQPTQPPPQRVQLSVPPGLSEAVLRLFGQVRGVSSPNTVDDAFTFLAGCNHSTGKRLSGCGWRHSGWSRWCLTFSFTQQCSKL